MEGNDLPKRECGIFFYGATEKGRKKGGVSRLLGKGK
jgi:hypothetical protein